MPEKLWPPHFTAVSSPCSRAKCTTRRTSSTPLGCTITAGRRSMDGFSTWRAFSYPSVLASSSRPRSPSRRSFTAVPRSVTVPPSPRTASTSERVVADDCRKPATDVRVVSAVAAAVASVVRRKVRRCMEPPRPVWPLLKTPSQR